MRDGTLRRCWVGFGALLITAVAATPAAAEEVSSRPRPSATFDDNVMAVAYGGGVVFVGGRFRTAEDAGASADRSRLAAVDAASGRLLDWGPRPDGAVQAIARYGDSVYIAGDFTHVDGEPRYGLAKLDAATGALDPSFAPTVGGRALALAVGNGRLYVGGSLTSINGHARDSAGAVTLGTGATAGWAPHAAGTVHTLAATSDRVYLGGTFSELNGSTAYRKFAAVDPVSGATDTGFKPGLSAIVRDTVVTSGTIYAAVGGVGGRLIAFRTNGTQRWSVTANGDFQAVALLGDTIYAGGHFNTICSSPRTDPDGTCLDDSVGRRKLAAFDTSGHLLGWAPQADSDVGVQAIAADAGSVTVGGAFTTLGSGTIDQPHFAQFG